MIIKTLHLNHYRRFQEQFLEFPENVLGLVGPNGAGKSTIIEAIAWALYGNRAARGNKAEIRTHGISPREQTEVRLVFEIHGAEYQIVRQLRGKHAVVEAAVYQAGQDEPLAVQESGVNRFVEQLIGLDYRSFFASVFARQKDLAALGNMQPEERRQAINRLINIDAIDRARDLARQERNELINQMHGMEKMLQDPEVLERELAELTQQVRRETEAEKMAHDSFKQADSQFQESRKTFESLSRLRDQHMKIEAEIGKIITQEQATREQLQQLSQELAKIERSKHEWETLQDKVQQFEQLKKQKEALDEQRLKAETVKHLQQEYRDQSLQIQDDERIIQNLEKELQEEAPLTRRLAELEARSETLQKEMQQLQQHLMAIHREKGVIENQGKELREKREKIDSLGKDSPCPVCTRPLGEHYESVKSHFEQEIQRLRQEWKTKDQQEKRLDRQISEKTEALQSVQKEHRELNRRLGELQSKQQKLEEARKRKQRFQEKAREIQEKIEKLGEVHFDPAQYEQVVAQFESLQKVYEHSLRLKALIDRQPEVEQRRHHLEAERRRLEQEHRKLTQRLEKLNYREEMYEKAKETYNEHLERVNALRNRLAEARQALALARERLQQTERELERIREQKKKIEETREQIQYLTALIDHFGRFRLHLASRLRPLIAARASELLRLTTSGRYSLMELDEDYNIRILDQGETFPLHRFSGGEQDLANLCLRIAISQVVAERSGKPPIQFIVLDEIFGSQDLQRQQLILQALQQLQSQFRQIFIISHVEAVKEILPVIIQVEIAGPVKSIARML